MIFFEVSETEKEGFQRKGERERQGENLISVFCVKNFIYLLNTRYTKYTNIP